MYRPGYVPPGGPLVNAVLTLPGPRMPNGPPSNQSGRELRTGHAEVLLVQATQLLANDEYGVLAKRQKRQDGTAPNTEAASESLPAKPQPPAADLIVTTWSQHARVRVGKLRAFARTHARAHAQGKAMER